MARADYRYVIVGGGLAGASAIAGIREVDTDGRILLIGAENHLPYDRPPLTKKLWFGKQTLEAITLHDRAWYEGNGVELLLGCAGGRRRLHRLRARGRPPYDRRQGDDGTQRHAPRTPGLP